jgi:hypothetical protein
MDHACVHAGDTQGLTVHGQARRQVIFDTVYSDNSDEMTRHYGTGYGYGKTDDHGTFHTTWVLAANVPSGPAQVNVGASNYDQIADTHVKFVINDRTKAC